MKDFGRIFTDTVDNGTYRVSVYSSPHDIYIGYLELYHVESGEHVYRTQVFLLHTYTGGFDPLNIYVWEGITANAIDAYEGTRDDARD